jgi:hypothetical protein
MWRMFLETDIGSDRQWVKKNRCPEKCFDPGYHGLGHYFPRERYSFAPKSNPPPKKKTKKQTKQKKKKKKTKKPKQNKHTSGLIVGA